MQAGEYALPADINIAAILTMMRQGLVVKHRLTVAEGLTAPEIIALLNQEPALGGPIDNPPKEGELLRVKDDQGNYSLAEQWSWSPGASRAQGSLGFWPGLDPRAAWVDLMPTATTARAVLRVPLPRATAPPLLRATRPSRWALCVGRVP